MPDTPLVRKLGAKIAAGGPLSVAEFMDSCLADPDHGYYRTRDPLGARGDFITAPEISQIFGELIGLWCAEVWRAMDAPELLRLVELGPGRGTLMADAMRAAAIVPEFGRAARLHLVETGPVLRKAQKEQLAGFAPRWHEAIGDVPPGATIVIANEFLDALPIRQFVYRGGGWRERCVNVDPLGVFVFCERDEPCADNRLIPTGTAKEAGEGAIAEIRPAVDVLVEEFAARAAAYPLVVLVIDYGHVRSGPGDTLQAVAGHGYANPLDSPGEHDLTAHVDFEQLAEAAAAGGLDVHGPLSQREFLLNLGLAQRCEQLMKGADKKMANEIESGAGRLVDQTQMGALFKVLALTGKTVPAPPPF